MPSALFVHVSSAIGISSIPFLGRLHIQLNLRYHRPYFKNKPDVKVEISILGGTKFAFEDLTDA